MVPGDAAQKARMGDGRGHVRPRHSSHEDIPRPSSNDSGFADCSGPSSQFYVALYDYTAQNKDELSFAVGSYIKRTDCGINESGWYQGEINGRRGLFPVNYTEVINILMRYEADEIEHLGDGDPEHGIIGHGATAAVYKVKIVAPKEKKMSQQSMGMSNVHVDREVALKKFKEGFAHKSGVPYSKETAVEKLKKEALTLNSLSHENIIQFIGYCTDKPFFGLLLELCQGGSLQKLCLSLDSDKAMPLTVLIDWAIQIATGMEYLTSKRKVHRDLKADNVLVKQIPCKCDLQIDQCSRCGGCGLGRLQLKIGDFGTSRQMATKEQMSEVGTYAWIAPESFSGRHYTEFSDVWSFGVLLWEILTRDVPYKGCVPVFAAFAVSRNGQSLAIDRHCPKKWKTVMQKCWEKEPTERPRFQEIRKYFMEYATEVRNKRIMIPYFAKEVEEIYDAREEAIEVVQNYYGMLGPNKPLPKTPSKSSSVFGSATSLKEAGANLKNTAKSLMTSLIFVKEKPRNSRGRASLSPGEVNDGPRPRSSGDYPGWVDSNSSSPTLQNKFSSDRNLEKRYSTDSSTYYTIHRPQDRTSSLEPESPQSVVNSTNCSHEESPPIRFVINPLYFSIEEITKEIEKKVDVRRDSGNEYEVPNKDAIVVKRIKGTFNSYFVEAPRRYTNLKCVEETIKGLVFSASDTVDMQNVQITRIHLFDRNGGCNIGELYKEIAVMSSIKHPYVAPLLLVFNSTISESGSKSTYLVTKTAETLKSALGSGKIERSVDHRKLSYFLYHMLCAIKHLHDCEVIHQNLTTSSIIINDDDTLQIQNIRTSESFHYRAPEEFFEMPKTAKVDIWAIGCIFAELYTHSVLFPGMSRRDQWLTIQGVLGISPKNFLDQLVHSETDRSNENRLVQILGAHVHKENSLQNEHVACDLLSRLLKINPSERISAKDALEHPYVKKWFGEEDVNCPPVRVQWKLEITDEMTKDEVEEMFAEKLNEYKLESGQ